MAEAQKRDYLVAFLTDMILVSKAAEEQKLGDTDRIQAKAGIRPQQAADVGAC